MTKKEEPVENDLSKITQEALAEIKKKYGAGSLWYGTEDAGLDIECYPTRVQSINNITGIGGIPRGRIIEILGPESSGKTTLAIICLAAAQEAGKYVAFIDVEHALDLDWAKLNGLDTSKLFISQPTTGEEALEITRTLAQTGEFGAIVIDSVAALVPEAELKGEIGDSHVGIQARLMSQAMRILTGTIKKTGTTVIMTNQIRYKIGIMFGNPETSSGGSALKYYTSIRFDVRRGAQIKEKIGAEDVVVGNISKIKVIKNKVAPPFKITEIQIRGDCGVDVLGDTIDTAITAGIIDKSGAWYSYKETKLGQGYANTRQLLQDNPDILKEIVDNMNCNDINIKDLEK